MCVFISYESSNLNNELDTLFYSLYWQKLESRIHNWSKCYGENVSRILTTNWMLTSYTQHPRLRNHQGMGGQKDCGTRRRKCTRKNYCLLDMKWERHSWTHSSCDWLQDINYMIAWSLKELMSFLSYLKRYWQLMASGGSVISFGFLGFFLGCGPWWVNHNTPQCMVPHSWHPYLSRTHLTQWVIGDRWR